MSINSNSCVETPAAPDWLSKLEDRREKLKRAKLGHEAGAGAPCNECGSKCPGLDLHFWRKVCRNCKCRKDQHMCQDDEVSGWAQFEILGQIRSKPAFIKIKTLANQPVKVEWIPPNVAPDLAADYMEKLGTANVPVAGSEAAAKRKQQLEFQVPPHDLDAGLCDNLTESEADQLQQYVQKIRDNCVGQGNVFRVGNYANALLGTINTLNKSEMSVMHFLEETPVNTLVNIISSDKVAKAITTVPLYDFRKEYLSNPFAKKEIDRVFGQQTINNSSNDSLLKNTSKFKNDLTFNSPLKAEANIKSGSQMSQETPMRKVQFGKNSTIVCDSNLPMSMPEARFSCGIADTNLSDQVRKKLKNIGGPYIPVNMGLQQALSASKSTDSGFESKPSTPIQGISPLVHPDEINALSGKLVSIPGIEEMNMYPTVSKGIQNLSLTEFRQHQQSKQNNVLNVESRPILKCRDCSKSINFGEVAVKAERAGKEIAWHPECFKCYTCRELLADLVYFFHGGQVFCGRDLAVHLKIPRCKACDELIFTKEYTAAEGATFHIKHFCCYHCDLPLAGQQYIPDEKSNMPLCLKCYEEYFAIACQRCSQPIGPSDQGVAWVDIHWHDTCFTCAGCCKSLIGGRFCVKQNKPFCSPACVRSMFK